MKRSSSVMGRGDGHSRWETQHVEGPGGKTENEALDEGSLLLPPCRRDAGAAGR